jgi:hypothetical protein
MKYIDERNGKVKESNYLRLVNGESEFTAQVDNQGTLIITKINFDDSAIIIMPKVSNQIGLK